MKEALTRVWRRVEDFFLAPASPRPLAVLRIGLALVLGAQAWELRTSVLDFFSSGGIIQGDLAQALGVPGMPRLNWIIHTLAPLHLGERPIVYSVCALYLASLVFLGLGFFTRGATALCFLLHWILVNTSETASYGVDLYAHVFLFYLIWMPSGDAFSLDARRRGLTRASSSSMARLGLRVLQIHLCISYFCSAIEKAQGPQWWNGELMWRALNLPVYRQFDFSWLASWPHLSMALGISSLLLEMGYAVFIWPRRTRPYWVLGIVGMHLGIAFFLGLGFFGVLMALLTLAVFGTPSEPIERSVVLYDGACQLCDSTVAFIIRRDPRKRFAFASLQSEIGRSLLRKHGLPTEELNSIVLIDQGGCHRKSEAILRILWGLSGAWPTLTLGLLVPPLVRDIGYGIIAKHRHSWFGKKDLCPIGASERFL